jgi:membrane fusion protein (multidrug efflux system)
VSRKDDDDDDDKDDDDDEEMVKEQSGHADHLQIELKLANGNIFPQKGKIGAIEADFNNTTGNIAFRADFANPEGLLRNGQTGTVLIHRTLAGVTVIPQRATFEVLDKRYAFVVDADNIVHQRDITVQSEQDDIFVIKGGLSENDKIVFEGIRQVRDGDKIEYEFVAPESVLSNLKYHAE